MSCLLMIDDDTGFCEMMADYLEPAGFEVTSIYNGMDALKQVLAAAKDEYDLILLDITLPGMNGFEVLQWHPFQAEHACNHVNRPNSGNRSHPRA